MTKHSSKHLRSLQSSQLQPQRTKQRQQHKMDITSFLNDENSDSALYMNYRSLPSYIDGLKNSGRKSVYTIKKHHINGRMHVSALGCEAVLPALCLPADAALQ